MNDYWNNYLVADIRTWADKAKQSKEHSTLISGNTLKVTADYIDQLTQERDEARAELGQLREYVGSLEHTLGRLRARQSND